MFQRRAIPPEEFERRKKLANSLSRIRGGNGTTSTRGAQATDNETTWRSTQRLKKGEVNLKHLGSRQSERGQQGEMEHQADTDTKGRKVERIQRTGVSR